MVFSSTIFLFFFLPAVLLIYLISGRAVKNLVLLAASLLFYAWGENIYLLLMLVSICMNYIFGLLIDRSRRHGQSGKAAMIFAVAANLGLLAFFKYANFIVDNLNIVLARLQITPINLEPVHLPIGISFFTFQALSYIIDLYRGQSQVQKNIINIALYISLFPQLIAGPIVRYHDIAAQIKRRSTTYEDLFYGIRRFIIGLGKKVLIANSLGRAADYIFSLPPGQLDFSFAWLGAIAYTLQIYYDFSGYSDMAIGLGRMFGFRFLENFNYPYISKSIREFWRRWHISLSSWFRDYLYIPLGGSRAGNSRTYFNLIVVFFLCGLWHGASWTFVAWGLYHGFFLVCERLASVRRLLDILPAIVRHCYVILAVIVGWVIFRADTIQYAFEYLRAMVSFNRPELYNSQIFLTVNNEFYFALIIGIIFSAPLYHRFEKIFNNGGVKAARTAPLLLSAASVADLCFLAFVFIYSVASLMGGAYNPFLYFRF